MLAVTAYPILYAVWLSLHRYNLASPADTAFVGLANYATILTDKYWWTAFFVTTIITVISVAIEFVLGLALALVMHRTIFGKGLVRTAILIPYGIVTAAASYSWYYAWTPGTGYLANLAARRLRSADPADSVAGRRHRSGGVEDDPVHGPAAAGRPSLWCPTTCSRRPRSTALAAWTRLTRVIILLIKPAILVALLFRTAGRVPHLRQHLRAHRRRQ